MDTHERCFLCSFFSGSRCTNTWRLVFIIEPQEGGIGGQVDFVCTPGMVPEELKPKLTEYFQRFIEKLSPAISMMPIWTEIREWQVVHEGTNRDCPGRKEREDIKPYLQVVRTPL